MSRTIGHPDLAECILLNFRVLLYSTAFRENLIPVALFPSEINILGHPRRKGKIPSYLESLRARGPGLQVRQVNLGLALPVAKQQAGATLRGKLRKEMYTM